MNASSPMPKIRRRRCVLCSTTTMTVVANGDHAAVKGVQTAIVCHGAMDTRVESRPIPAPKAAEAQIKVVMTGLCGSDLHFYLKGRGIREMAHPMVLGHESCGIVTALGPDQPVSSTLKVGDRVALEVGVSCRSCSYCTSGRYNLCPQMSFAASTMAIPHRDGTLQEYLCHPSELCFQLPDTLSLSLAALAEPLGVVIHAQRRAGLRPGARVMILGLGAVGLLTAALARASGCTTVIGCDIEQGKLDFALEQKWVNGTFCFPRGPRASGLEACEVAENNWSLLQRSDAMSNLEGLHHGFDVVFECSGVESCMQLAVMAAAPGAKAVFIGLGTSHFLLRTRDSIAREVDVIGVFRYANTYREALALLASGQLGDVSKLVTHRYPLENAVEAFEDLRRGRDKDGRTVIKPMVGTWVE